jgi:hypothetical protein
MKPLEQLAHRVTFRSGIIVFAAMVVLALSSTSARRVGLAVIARPRGVGPSGRTPSSFTTTTRKRAVTSRRGSSRRFSLRN